MITKARASLVFVLQYIPFMPPSAGARQFWWTLILIFSGAFFVATLPFLIIGPPFWWPFAVPPEAVVGMLGAVTLMGVLFRLEGSI